MCRLDFMHANMTHFEGKKPTVYSLPLFLIH